MLTLLPSVLYGVIWWKIPKIPWLIVGVSICGIIWIVVQIVLLVVVVMWWADDSSPTSIEEFEENDEDLATALRNASHMH